MASLVFPFHDPQNVELKFLKQTLPILEANFTAAYVSVTPQTESLNKEAMEFFENSKFFVVNKNDPNSSIGEHFIAAFKSAAEKSNNDEILHLCSPDRLAFAVINYTDAFLDDLKEVQGPVLFMRSDKAWSTHPKIYWAAESLVTQAGKMLFDKVLDFAWCHLALSAEELKKVIPLFKSKDLVVTAEIVYLLKDVLATKYVDWLSWEDPFILGKDAEAYKNEREVDPSELTKRMSYVKPQIDYLFEEYTRQKR